MKLFNNIRSWLKRQKYKHCPAELEIYTTCNKTHYLVWEPKGFRCETFETLTEAKQYAERMGWQLV